MVDHAVGSFALSNHADFNENREYTGVGSVAHLIFEAASALAQ